MHDDAAGICSALDEPMAVSGWTGASCAGLDAAMSIPVLSHCKLGASERGVIISTSLTTSAMSEQLVLSGELTARNVDGGPEVVSSSSSDEIVTLFTEEDADRLMMDLVDASRVVGTNSVAAFASSFGGGSSGVPSDEADSRRFDVRSRHSSSEMSLLRLLLDVVLLARLVSCLSSAAR